MTAPSETPPDAAARTPRPLLLGFVLGIAAYMLAVPPSARIALAFMVPEGMAPTALQQTLAFLGSQLHVLVCVPLVVFLAGLTATGRQGRALAFATAISSQLIPLAFLVAFDATGSPLLFLPVLLAETALGGLFAWGAWELAQRLMRKRAEAVRRRADAQQSLSRIDFEAVARAQREAEGAAAAPDREDP